MYPKQMQCQCMFWKCDFPLNMFLQYFPRVFEDRGFQNIDQQSINNKCKIDYRKMLYKCYKHFVKMDQTWVQQLIETNQQIDAKVDA